MQEAELTLMPVTVTELRKEVVEFSHLLGTTSFGMLVRRPTYTPKPDALLRPFNNEVRERGAGVRRGEKRVKRRPFTPMLTLTGSVWMG